MGYQRKLYSKSSCNNAPQGEEIKYDYHFKEKSIFPVPGYSDNKTDRLTGRGGAIQDFAYNNPFQRAYLGCNTTELSRTISGRKYDEITLKSITAPYEKIEFLSDYERSDLIGGRKPYAVEHYVNQKLIRTVKLYHENIISNSQQKGYEFYLGSRNDSHYVVFFQDGSVAYDYKRELIANRLVLKKVEVVGDDGSSTLPAHEFDYDRIDELPVKTSLGIDAFGFYNGEESNSMLIPAMSFPYALVNGSTALVGADRDTRPNKAKIGVISKVTYPTGGETVFEFESTDYNSAGNQYGPGLRVTALIDYSAPGVFAKRVSYDYKNENGISNGRIYNKPDLSYPSLRVCDDRWTGSITINGNSQNSTSEGTIACGGGIQSGNSPYGAYRVMVRQSGSITPVSSTNFGNVVVYSSVTKNLENQDKTQNIGKVVSEFHANFGNGASFVDQFRGLTAPLFVDPIIGSPISRKTFDKSGGLVHNVEYEVISTETETPNWNTSLRFDRLVFDYFANAASSDPQTYLNVCESSVGFCGLNSFLNYMSSLPFPSFAMYADHTYWVRTRSTTTTEYREDGGQVITTESTEYNSDNYAVASTSVSRAGVGKTTSYRYAHELGSDYQFLVDAHLTSVPIEVTTPNGDVFTTEYSPQHLVPQKFYQRFSQSDLVTRSFVETFYPLGYPKKVYTFGLDDPQIYTWEEGLITNKDIDGYIQEYHYDNKRRLEYSVDIDGLATRYYYDALQRTEKVVSRKTSINDLTERVSVSYIYTYAPGENSVTTTTEFEDAPSVTSVSKFDGLGRPVSETVEEIEKSRSVYDEFGRVKKQLYMPGYGMSTVGYDESPLMRVKSNNPPGAGIIRFNHLTNGGNTMAETIDEKGHSSFGTTDVFGRPLEQEDHLGNKTIYLGYTADDQPLNIKPPVGPEYSYTYNPRHLLESKTIPGGGTTNFGYDLYNRLKSSATPNGMVIGVAYDYLGRQVRTFKIDALSSGQPYPVNYTGEGLLTTTTFGTSGVKKGKVTASAAALILPDGSIGSMVNTDLSGFDAIGRPWKSTETYQLDGENFTDINNLVYDSRDLVLHSTFNHDNVSLSQTTDFDVFTRPREVSSTLKLITEGLTGNMDISMLYNDADQLTNRRLMEAQSGFYQEQFSYGARGWLEKINNPAPRSFDAILCGEPTGNVYEQEFIEEPTPIADIFTALNNGDPVNIPELDCVFEEPPVGDCQYDAEVGDFFVVIGNPIKKGRGAFANAANLPCPSGTTCSSLIRSQNLGFIDDIVITGIGINSSDGPANLSLTSTYSLNEILLSTQQEGINKPVLSQFRQDVLNAANDAGWFIREVDFSVQSDANNCTSCQANGAKNYGLEITFREVEAAITHLDVAYTYRTNSTPDVSKNFIWSIPTSKKGDREIKPVPCPKEKFSDDDEKVAGAAAAGAKKETDLQSWDEWFEQQLETNLPPPTPYLPGAFLRGTSGNDNTTVSNNKVLPLRTRIVVSPADISLADSALISETSFTDCSIERTDLRASSSANTRSSVTSQNELAANQRLTVTRTLTEIRFREAQSTLLVRLAEEGLPYRIHQGELLEEQTTANNLEKDRVKQTLQSWLAERPNGQNEVSVSIDEKGKLAILLYSNELEFITATYSSVYTIETVCPDGTTELTEVSGVTVEQATSHLLHRSGTTSSLKTSSYTPARHLARQPLFRTSATKNTATNKKLTGTDCGPIDEPNCTDEQTAAQLEQVNEFYATTDQEYLDDLSYPNTLQSVMLCDGSIVYLLADQVGILVGNFVVLNQITLNGPDDLINALVRDQQPNPLFSLQLDYEKNGNIKEAEWKTTYFSPKKYVYKYDELNRIKSADYNQTAAGPNSSLADDLFSVSNITYDPIGNIKTLTRRGMTGCGPGLKKGEIDVLTYYYGSNTASESFSQLREITDAAADEDLAAQGLNTKAGGEYGYDSAGRMTGDPYRGLTIRYNHLDLPREIDSPDGLIQITYDANGQKRLYHVAAKYTRRYAGPLTFEKAVDEDNYVLEAATTGDGRLVYEADSKEVYPEYHHRDHLGNTRLTFTDRNQDKLVEIIGNGNEVNQIMDFYPFGLQQQGEGVFGPSVESSNRYRFNGKELVDEIGLYDYGARWYCIIRKP